MSTITGLGEGTVTTRAIWLRIEGVRGWHPVELHECGGFLRGFTASADLGLAAIVNGGTIVPRDPELGGTDRPKE